MYYADIPILDNYPVELYLHTKDNAIFPNKRGLMGMAVVTIRGFVDITNTTFTVHCVADVSFAKIRMKSVDRPSEPCTNEGPSLAKCLAKYADSRANCSSEIMGGEVSNRCSIVYDTTP